MKLPTRPAPTLDSLPPGTQRLTVDGKREVFYTPLADGPWPAEALTALFCDHLPTVDLHEWARDIPTGRREIASFIKTFKE